MMRGSVIARGILLAALAGPMLHGTGQAQSGSSDPEAEVDFLRDCAAVFRGRTVILVTHRPASLALADRIVRLESVGRVAAGAASPVKGAIGGVGPVLESIATRRAS